MASWSLKVHVSGLCVVELIDKVPDFEKYEKIKIHLLNADKVPAEFLEVDPNEAKPCEHQPILAINPIFLKNYKPDSRGSSIVTNEQAEPVELFELPARAFKVKTDKASDLGVWVGHSGNIVDLKNISESKIKNVDLGTPGVFEPVICSFEFSKGAFRQTSLASRKVEADEEAQVVPVKFVYGKAGSSHMNEDEFNIAERVEIEIECDEDEQISIDSQMSPVTKIHAPSETVVDMAITNYCGEIFSSPALIDFLWYYNVVEFDGGNILDIGERLIPKIADSSESPESGHCPPVMIKN